MALKSARGDPFHVFCQWLGAGALALLSRQVLLSDFYGIRNRATFSDSRSNFHTRVGYRTNVCRRWLASDLARASEVASGHKGPHEDHHDLLPGSLRHRLSIPPSLSR